MIFKHCEFRILLGHPVQCKMSEEEWIHKKESLFLFLPRRQGISFVIVSLHKTRVSDLLLVELHTICASEEKKTKYKCSGKH